MQMWNCTRGSNQKWEEIYQNIPTASPANTWYETNLRNRYSGLCLDLYYGSNTNGAPAIQYPCNPNDQAQKFYITWDFSSGEYSIGVAPNVFLATSSKCLDDHYAGRNNGNPVDFWDCNGTAAQLWNKI